LSRKDPPVHDQNASAKGALFSSFLKGA
jgi:hypothetical protein